MRGFKEKDFNDRLADQQKARQALLDRARKAAPQNDPEFAARQAERKRIAEERDARLAAKAAEKATALKVEAERKIAEEAARIEADKLAKEEAEKSKRVEADKLVDQARKDRTKKKR